MKLRRLGAARAAEGRPNGKLVGNRAGALLRRSLLLRAAAEGRRRLAAPKRWPGASPGRPGRKDKAWPARICPAPDRARPPRVSVRYRHGRASPAPRQGFPRRSMAAAARRAAGGATAAAMPSRQKPSRCATGVRSDRRSIRVTGRGRKASSQTVPHCRRGEGDGATITQIVLRIKRPKPAIPNFSARPKRRRLRAKIIHVARGAAIAL